MIPPQTKKFVRRIYIKRRRAAATAGMELRMQKSYAMRDGRAMAANIQVEQAGEGQFRVRVKEGTSQTEHRVTVKPEDYNRLTGGKVEASELVRRSFEFLLENEPKESILGQFDLSVIGRYFPQFEAEIKRRL
jgi:hypothetical protein